MPHQPSARPETGCWWHKHLQLMLIAYTELNCMWRLYAFLSVSDVHTNTYWLFILNKGQSKVAPQFAVCWNGRKQVEATRLSKQSLKARSFLFPVSCQQRHKARGKSSETKQKKRAAPPPVHTTRHLHAVQFLWCCDANRIRLTCASPSPPAPSDIIKRKCRIKLHLLTCYLYYSHKRPKPNSLGSLTRRELILGRELVAAAWKYSSRKLQSDHARVLKHTSLLVGTIMQNRWRQTALILCTYTGIHHCSSCLDRIGEDCGSEKFLWESNTENLHVQLQVLQGNSRPYLSIQVLQVYGKQCHPSSSSGNTRKSWQNNTVTTKNKCVSV